MNKEEFWRQRKSYQEEIRKYAEASPVSYEIAVKVFGAEMTSENYLKFVEVWAKVRIDLAVEMVDAELKAVASDFPRDMIED